ncbi:uncharacterized protein N7500_002713 [Penicillium coprophilum]|uniref:uncharacterized protein n=1 Tax=Penicillium coprophilum TaxID=36646 RepID=UPI002391F58B|nr:uncharacterized protein N7500_002713 [Penicillium coprophilum]KAJ5169930.1 hypothetical protein N7500_002713 [Penicillium coprophilum]
MEVGGSRGPNQPAPIEDAEVGLGRHALSDSVIVATFSDAFISSDGLDLKFEEIRTTIIN